ATITGLLEALRAWYAPVRFLPRFRIEGVEHLHAALAHGRGAIVLLAHFTPLELALRLLREGSGLSFSSMKRPHNNACLEAEIDRRRRLHYGLTIDKDDPRGVRAALQRGELLIYAADQDFNFGHAFLPFFGVPAATLTATPRIARRSGAPVLPF